AAECGKNIVERAQTWTGRGGVNVNLKKLLTWAAVALVLFFLISAPTQASGLVTHILDLLKNAATAIVDFVKTLFA
ncbi:MAG TPA: hypothetical protein VG317_17530, partial [Pseudonocardiaceae bacterium]|nr:hypothetical protein [Pseudonocardiaceae bacterium]